MRFLRERSSGIEIMDDLQCAGEVVHQTLRELDVINRLLGGNAVTVQGLHRLLKLVPAPESLHVADLGCGSGEMLRLLSTRLTKKYPGARFTGIDANPHIVAYAQQHVAGESDIHIAQADILSATFRQQSFDVILATLFLHHFSSEQLVEIFSNLHRQARVGIVVNDLHRHPLAYYSIKFLTRLFSRSTMVQYDAPLSVARGFSRAELEAILKAAGITVYSLRWRWAFRWSLVIPTAKPTA